MKKNILFFLSLFFIFLLLAPAQAAGNADLAIDQGSITFSTNKFYSGETVRIYARIRNLGDVDMQASVVFYNGAKVVGATQPVSLRVAGAPEEVFVDFLVPVGSFNIHAVIAGSSPADENASNDDATTVLYTVLADADRDEVLDEDDNCQTATNTDQADLDHDNTGDACDSVDDTPKPVVVAPPTPAPLPTPIPVTSTKTSTVAPVATSVTTVTAPGAASSTAVAANSTTSTLANGTATVLANTAPSSASDGTVWPEKAYGIFDNVVAAEPEAVDSSVSFWHLTNPVVQILLIVLGLFAIGCLLSVIIVRRRSRPSYDQETL